jgi:hyaluronate lyase
VDTPGATSSFETTVQILNQPSGIIREFSAIEDSYITQEYPTGNYGGSQRLSFRAGLSGKARYSYLKFNVTNVSGTIVSAKLILTETYGRDIGELRVFRVFDTSWGESTITWDTAPWNATLHTTVFNLAAFQTHEIDVTGILSGNGQLTIGLSTAADEYLFVGSREDYDFDRRPMLRVIYQP